jgi:hypothetical protein
VVLEQTLSVIWQAQWLRRDALRTIDGRAVRVVYRGRWTHGLGPDFRDAMLVFDDGPLVRGDIELHRRAIDWAAHGHEHDQRYASVVLHVTYDEQPAVCRRPDGEVVPQLALAPALPAPVEQFTPPAFLPLGALGDGPCASHVVTTHPALLLATVQDAGRQRLRQKAAVVEAAAAPQSPDQSLYADLAEALGYAQNRAPFRALAAHLPLTALDALAFGLPPDVARVRLAAVLLGVAGFLPWSEPGGQHLPAALSDALNAEWARHGDAWQAADWTPAWELARVRPANHPARRLLGLAALLARAGPALYPRRLTALATGGNSADLLAACAAEDWTQPAAAEALIGRDRATEIAVNVAVVHALARAPRADPAATAAAEAMAARLPVGALSAPARAMLAQFGGSPRLRVRSALEHQGLLHLHGRWCATRRCYECPVAALVSGRPACS